MPGFGRGLADRLSYANVAATLALFISLGGASYAVVTLPAGSVGTTQLRAGAVSTSKLGFPLGMSSTSAASTMLNGPSECVRAPCPGSGPQVLASLSIPVKRPVEAYVEATGSFTATESGKEANIGVSLSPRAAKHERAPQTTVTAVGGRSTPFSLATTVPLIGASEVGGRRFANLVTLRASQISVGARVMAGEINMVAIVLPPLAARRLSISRVE